ncbi:MAG: 4,5-DOPA dioxygenase extradiol [Lachnospiraceae bacterium]
MAKNTRMPVIFSGHGSPMLALEHNDITETLKKTGEEAIAAHGVPRAILAISAHWYQGETLVQSAAHPKQIYDMYGFPKELYEVKYNAVGSPALTDEVKNLLGGAVRVDDSWGIDHGTWTVLVHMFPKADIPVVQLSVNGRLTPEKCADLGRKLAPLRDAGYLILGSGNVVHNLRMVDWDNENGSPACIRFNDYITEAVLSGDNKKALHYGTHPDASYAVPTPDHFLPLCYCLGAADGDAARAFNNVCNLGAIAMTGYVFGD